MIAHFGIYDENGGIERDTVLCTLTGQPVGGVGVTCRITGTRLFYKLSITARRRITPEQRAQIEQAIREAAESEAKAERRKIKRAPRKVLGESEKGEVDADDA